MNKFRVVIEKWNPDIQRWEKKRRITIDEAFRELLKPTNTYEV